MINHCNGKFGPNCNGKIVQHKKCPRGPRPLWEVTGEPPTTLKIQNKKVYFELHSLVASLKAAKLHSSWKLLRIINLLKEILPNIVVLH